MTQEQAITDMATLEESGKGYCFKVRDPQGSILPAFIIRFNNQPYAYLNRCGHIAVRLDYMPGEFFSDDGQTLMCSTHGAEYAPDTGACLGGPCYGIGLEPLDISQQGARLYLQAEGFSLVASE